jgi:hypothetical protein
MLGRLLGLCAFVALLASALVCGQAAAAATTNGRIVLLNGKPFFPVMLIDQCSGGDVSRARALGINLILNETCAGISPQRQLEMIRGKSLAVLPIHDNHVRGGGLVGWAYPDEPENNHWTPASLKSQTSDPPSDGLVSFLTTGGGFFHGPYRDARVPLSSYSGFAQIANVSGFDLYPLGHCQTDLTPVYAAQVKFNALAGKRPTFQWIETGPIKPGYCGGFQMTPDELKAEVWLAIIGGARGIGFFTHTWTPDEHAFDVAPPVQKAMRWVAQLISDVRPGLLGETVLSGSNSSPVKVLARTGGKRTYVFAANASRGPIKVQLHVPQIRDGALRVYGEGRSVDVRDHRFVDTFKPLETRVYVQAR